MIRFGGPLFGVDATDPDAVAKACKALGYGAIYCPDLNPDDEPACRDYGRAIARHGLMIAEAGVWINSYGEWRCVTTAADQFAFTFHYHDANAIIYRHHF